MEHDGSLPHSQMPANCPYPEPAFTLKCFDLLYFTYSKFSKFLFAVALNLTVWGEQDHRNMELRKISHSTDYGLENMITYVFT